MTMVQVFQRKKEEAILPFNRLKIEQRTGGIGLGLSIAYNAILSHGENYF